MVHHLKSSMGIELSLLSCSIHYVQHLGPPARTHLLASNELQEVLQWLNKNKFIGNPKLKRKQGVDNSIKN